MSTPEQPSAHGVRIEAQPGSATISIDGTPLPAGQVTGYVLEHSVRDSLPMLVLHTRQPEGVIFEGLATVAVAVPQQGHGDVIEQFLQGIDPAALSRAALDRADLDDGKHSVTEAILKQLADWAQGRT